MKKIKKWIPLLCTTLLLLCNCLTVCASDSDGSYPSDYESLGYDIVMTFDNTYVLLTTDVPLIVDTSSFSSMSYGPFYGFTNLDKSYNYRIYTTSNGLYGSGSKNASEWLTEHKYQRFTQHYTFCSSNYDVYHYNNTSGQMVGVFFHKPLTVMERSVVEMNQTIQNQLQIIIPIALSCLALLIGSLTLLPRLRMYL